MTGTPRPLRRVRVATFILMLACWPLAAPQAQQMGSSEAALIRTLLPTVVNISARMTNEEPGSPMTAASPQTQSPHVITLSGSGFVVDPKGIIATNYHVIGGAFEIIVTLADGSRTPATLMSGTKIGDIALLKVNVRHKLPATHWADSDKVQIGDPVLAIGNPLGIGMSVTSGIVSALNRDIMASPYDSFIQTDAPINHGNSGGPLFDSKGEVIGIDTALYSPTTGSVGIGFAIPSNIAQFVIGRLLKFGAVRPGWIGVMLQQVTPDIAEALGMNEPQGSIITEVAPDSPAVKTGLAVGDVILRFNGVTPSDTRALMRDIAVVPAGSSATVTLWHAGREQSEPITVADWPSAVKLDKASAPADLRKPIPPNLGLKLAALDAETRSRYGVDVGREGVLVTGVAGNCDAAERGMVAGDIITRIQDSLVRTPAEVLQSLDRARADKRKFVLMLVWPKPKPQSQAQPLAPAPKWMALRVGTG